MSDTVTEMVAHMIGLFQITLEENRSRSDYNEFNALRQRDPQIDPLNGIDAKLKAPYQLDGFKPAIKYSEWQPVTPRTTPDHVVPNNYLAVHGPWISLPGTALTPQLHLFPAEMAMARFHPYLEPPGSIVIITSQYNYLQDNDLLRQSDYETDFIDPAFYQAQMSHYLAIAQSISPAFALQPPLFDAGTHDYALALYHQLPNVSDDGAHGATTAWFSAADAYGHYENGVMVEVLTQLDDVMPAFLQKDDEGTAGPAEDQPSWAPGAFDGLDPLPNRDSPFPSDSGHHVVSGANRLINQTNIVDVWLDAPVISVMGDVVSLNIITQVNMLVEHPQFGNAGATLQSAAYNSAVMLMLSSAPANLTTDDAGTEGQAALSLPTHWAVTRVDGDILVINHVQQYSFMVDFDRADISFHSAHTYIDMGDNKLINAANLVEIGFGYDLIIIGGHMFTINQINQINMMIDNDAVTYDGIQPHALNGGDNLLFNGASITITGIDSYTAMQDNFAQAAQGLEQGGLSIDESVAHDSVFEGVDILRVLYVSGDVITINRVDQTNILGDSDQLHLALDNFQATGGAAITVTTGSNAAINLASISQYGVDSTVMVAGQVYDDALIYQAGLIDTDASPTGVNLPPALASEAVAFLATDMIIPDATEAPVIIATTLEGAGNSSDMMQTMLA